MYKHLVFIIIITCSKFAFAKPINVDVLVEDGYFPIIINAEKQQGLAPEFVKILNESQSDYNFVLNSLPVKRLKKWVEWGEFDMLFLMALQWLPETARSSLKQTHFYVIAKNELYTLLENSNEQAYFDNLNTLTKAGVLGYSYRFANFNTDAQYLSEEHQVSLTIDEFNVVKMLLLKRADVGVLNNIAYQYFKKNNIFNMDLLYKSNKPDAIYDTHFLVNPKRSKITENQMDELLNSPTIKPKIKALLSAYGVTSSFTENK
ncbi:hypothetical protein PESP_a1006 [Pseudoalteromonas espejiana DSM 9414]|uniref:ABC transporter substrate-binding protein n=1 Tax=Pseudoalteromonas espejiana TaxID=28107 RepID=A0A510XUQ7_9GAMM|nr:ABC transporter substrate-binding protein [Pseudoalteromonas espejiana]ASM49179.1 hypothetical protein PESP_a1006 [Pseudoalteromonas espejiana DSM 9414]GEK54762.1 hypothetical protein PES01_16070 [Pseudoalteromonas espejiana]